MYKLPLEGKQLDQADASHRQHKAGGEMNIKLQEELSNAIGREGLAALEDLRRAANKGGITELRSAANNLKKESASVKPRERRILLDYAKDMLTDVLPGGNIQNPSIVPVWSEEVEQIRSDLQENVSNGFLDRLKAIRNGWRKSRN